MRQSFFAAKGALAQHIFYDKTLSWDSTSVVHARIGTNQFIESKNATLKVSIPFGHTSIRASWQTASGQQKYQHVQGDHVAIMPASLAYETRWQRTSELIILCIQPAFIATVAEELMIGNSIEIIEHWTAIDPLIRQFGRALRHELQMGVPSQLYIDSLTTFLAIHLLKTYSTAQLKPNPVTVGSSSGFPPHIRQQVIDYIESNLEQDLSLESIAQMLNLSSYRFARAFKQSIGLSPHQYLLQRRIERAKQLLTQTQFPIYEISYLLGFSSQSHFSTVFRRLTGTTPKAYRDLL
ncbi:helix-turn-helix transcriptional regulator [Phormidium tenue FACHB-886]|nr:helix-turn-helix transcriptional regulator [Phormidium tenue FACHB-886]